MQSVESRVDRLETALEEFIKNVGIEFNKVYNMQMRNELEMKEFKEEMRQFREESERDRKALHEEMKEFKDEMKVFKQEMKEFKDEMKEFKVRQDEENRRKNKEWSNLAKKMGTIVEDLIAPALKPVLSNYFNCEVTMEGQRQFRRKDGENFEIDAIAGCDDKIFMVEARSTPRVGDIREIIEKKEKFFKFFPEYENKELFVIFGSISFPEEVIRVASKHKVYVLAWREWEYMDLLNFDQIN